MKIYTKTGDQGETSLVGGKRVKKSDPLLEAYGGIDELNASIGLIMAEIDVIELNMIQQQLFCIAGMLATEPEYWDKYWKREHVELYIKEIEKAIDAKSEQLTPLKSFILPRGSRAIVQTHLSRTICRRAERHIVSLADRDTSYLLLLQYVNRLSDFLFILSRYIHVIQNIPEIYWKPDK